VYREEVFDVGKLRRRFINISDLLSAIHKLINSVWNKEELSDKWKEFIIVTVHKKLGKTAYNNYRGISLLSTSYKMLSNIHLSKLGRT
jgi:hypothetical protein